MTGHKEEKDNDALARVMELLVDISSHLEAIEHGVELRTARSETPERPQSASIARPAT